MGCLFLHLAHIQARSTADILCLCLLASAWQEPQEFPVCPLTLKGTIAVKENMQVMSWCFGLSFITGSAGMCVMSGGIT